MPITGERIKALRIKRGYKQEDLAAMCGCSQSDISVYEKNPPDLRGSMIEKLALALNISEEYFFSDRPMEYYFRQQDELFYVELFADIPDGDKESMIKFIEAYADKCHSKSHRKDRRSRSRSVLAPKY